ncbi:unnamed protein product [Arctogadus glacialis]
MSPVAGPSAATRCGVGAPGPGSLFRFFKALLSDYDYNRNHIERKKNDRMDGDAGPSITACISALNSNPGPDRPPLVPSRCEA